jgi:hypothetical protein
MARRSTGAPCAPTPIASRTCRYLPRLCSPNRRRVRTHPRLTYCRRGGRRQGRADERASLFRLQRGHCRALRLPLGPTRRVRVDGGTGRAPRDREMKPRNHARRVVGDVVVSICHMFPKAWDEFRAWRNGDCRDPHVMSASGNDEIGPDGRHGRIPAGLAIAWHRRLWFQSDSLASLKAPNYRAGLAGDARGG